MVQETTKQRQVGGLTFERCVVLFVVCNVAALVVPGVLHPQPASALLYMSIATSVVASSTFGLLLIRTSAQDQARRAAVYVAAVASTQAPAIVSARAALMGPV